MLDTKNETEMLYPLAVADSDQEVLNAVNAIAAMPGRNDKEAALADLASTEAGKRVISWAYNPFITFGVTWKKEPTWTASGDGDDPNQLPIVHNLLTRLASRELTGNAAKEALQSAFDSLNPAAGKLLWLCVNKDLKAGINIASINSVMPGLVPIFAVMRAHSYEEKLVKKFPVAVEPKLDGNRVSFIANDGSGGFFTRTGKVIASLDHMVAPMLETLKSWFASSQGFGFALTSTNGIPNLMLDGEMMSEGGFNDLQGAMRRQSEDATDVSFHIFDCLSWEEFDAMGSVEVSYLERRKRVNSIVVHASTLGMAQKIKQTQIRSARSHEDIQKFYDEFRAAGYEGAMVKELDGFYDKKKSRSWLKLKAADTEDLVVVGVFQGQADGKYANTLGGLIVDRNGVKVRVSGLDDATREDVWNLWCHTCLAVGEEPNVGYEGKTFEPSGHAGPLLGRLIEVEFHEALESGSLRHPRFVRFRPDKEGEVEK